MIVCHARYKCFALTAEKALKPLTAQKLKNHLTIATQKITNSNLSMQNQFKHSVHNLHKIL